MLVLEIEDLTESIMYRSISVAVLKINKIFRMSQQSAATCDDTGTKCNGRFRDSLAVAKFKLKPLVVPSKYMLCSYSILLGSEYLFCCENAFVF